MFSLVATKNDQNLSKYNNSSKIKSIEVKNPRFNNNYQKKIEEISQIRAELQNFKAEKASLKHEEKLDFEFKKKMIQLSKLSLKQSVIQNKENIIKKNLDKKQGILKESKENEDFIKRRQDYYLKEAKEKMNEIKIHMRAKSETNGKKELDNDLSLIMEVKNQEDIIKKLELLLKEEYCLAGQIKNSKVIQGLNDSKFKVTKVPIRSKSTIKNYKIK